MSLRAIDWLRLAADKPVNDGLDEILKDPAGQISGPVSKIRWPLSSPRLPDAKWKLDVFEWDPWMTAIPRSYIDLGENVPRESLRFALSTRGYISTIHGGVDYLVGFHTPRDRRPHSYRSAEQAEAMALLHWEKRKSRLAEKLCKNYSIAYTRFMERQSKQLAKLTQRQRDALSKGRTEKVARIQYRINQVQYRINHPTSKALRKIELKMFKWASDEDKTEYVMERFDLLRASAAKEHAKWLAQPRLPLVMLPVLHSKVRQGYLTLQFIGENRYFAHTDPSEPGVQERISATMPLDNLLPTPSDESITGYAIQVDEQKLASAMRDAASNRFSGVLQNFTVDFVELRDAVASLQEVPNVIQTMQRMFKETVSRKFGQSVEAGLVSLEGLWSVFRYMSSRDLCYKFGTEDTVRFLKQYFVDLDEALSKAMRPFTVLLRENTRLRSVHRVIDRRTDQTIQEWKISDLLKAYPDAPSWVADLQLLSRLDAEGSKLRRVTTTVVEQRLTLQLKSRLENELGMAVGDDEALTRYFMTIMGLDKWIGAAWDLTPFSFVFDWFVDVGSFLNEVRIGGLHVSYDLVGGCISEETRTVVNFSVVNGKQSWRFPGGSHGTYVTTLDARPLVTKVFKRNVLSTECLRRYAPDMIAGNIRLGKLNAWQALTGAELLATRGPDNLSNLAKSIKKLKKLLS